MVSKYILAKKSQDRVKKGENLLRLLAFLPIFLFSSETFILPDEADHLMHTINQEMKCAKREIYVATPFLDDYSFIKTLKHTAKKGITITIITQGPIEESNQVSRLTLFNNITVFTLEPINHSEQIKGSVICIDEQKLFLLNDDISSKKMKSTYSFATSKQENCKAIFKTLLTRSKPY